VKTIDQAVAENAYWDQLVQKQAADTFYSDLFDAAFERQTEKLAALDPDYAAMLFQEQQKQAFNQAYAETLAQAQATAW
jgi:hypothetical protein